MADLKVVERLVVTPTGFKIGSKGRVINNADAAKSFYQQNDKGTNRAVRKRLRSEGRARFAGVTR